MHLIMNGKSFTLLRFLAFLFLLANVGCQKEISTETGLPLEVVVVVGEGPLAVRLNSPWCHQALTVPMRLFAGAFVAGTALGLDAMLTVTVNVTKTGDWTYSASLVNGFTFAGAGNFLITGNQVITFMAVGKPNAAGSSNFNLNIGGASNG